MPEHLIRFRGGWLWLDPRTLNAVIVEEDGPLKQGGNASGRRVTLPLTWPAATAERVYLARSFGSLAFDPDCERLSLRLSQVGGLAIAWLNGRVLARLSPGTSAIHIPLVGPLPRRNLLVLAVDVLPPDSLRAPGPWGEVALAIGPRPVDFHSGSD